MPSLVVALHVFFDPLCEYVHSLHMPVLWTDCYSQASCGTQLIQQNITHVYFVQRGPHSDLLATLIENSVAISIVNTEQMTRFVAQNAGEEVFFPFDAFLITYIRQNVLRSIVDYSFENINIWKQCFPDANCELRCFSIPPVVNDVCKSKHVAFVGDASSSYRQKIVTATKATVLTNTYGARRDVELYSHRVLVNVHFSPLYCVFEEIRCLPCVLNKMIVVSEDAKLDTDHPLYKFIIFAPYAQLASAVADALANYDTLYRKLFVNNSAFESLQKDIERYEARVTRLLAA